MRKALEIGWLSTVLVALLAVRSVACAAPPPAETPPSAVTNASTLPQAFAWSVKANPAITVSPGDALPILVAVGPVAATNVRAWPMLNEKSTKQPLAQDGLRPCKTRPCDPGAIALDAKSAQPVWLEGVSNVGVYEGTILVTSSQKPEGESVSVTVYSSTSGHKALGIFAILASVIVSWFGSAYVKNLIARDTLMVPAVILAATLKQLQATLATTFGPLVAPIVRNHLNATLQALQVDVLVANGLPSSMPASDTAPGAKTIEEFKRYVQAQSDWAQALLLLVNQGFLPAWNANPATVPAGYTREQAIADIDALANVTLAPATDALGAEVRAIVNRLAPQAPVAVLGARSAAPSAAASRAASPQQLEWQISQLNVAGWAFVMLATVLAGSYVLVLGPSANGFGTPVDYLQCVLWGLGLPAGSQLLSATTSSISTTLGVPK